MSVSEHKHQFPLYRGFTVLLCFITIAEVGSGVHSVYLLTRQLKQLWPNSYQKLWRNMIYD